MALAISVIAGCRAGLAAPSNTASGVPADSSPAASIAPSSPTCISLYESIDSLDPTLENLRQERRDVIVGTITRVDVAFWDSRTGKAPTPGEQPGEGNEFSILTPYVVTVDQTITGSQSPGEITVVIEGGRIGCNKLEVSPAVTLMVNSRYVLFLRPWLAADGTGPIGLPMAFQAFPVRADGTVLTPRDGAMTLAALSSALAPDVRSPAP